MKRTLLVLGMVLALAMTAMAGATAKSAPGHGNENGAVKGTATDDNFDQEVDYLFNKAGYHFWFTATTPGWAGSLVYTEGTDYHNIYKYQVDDPSEWCGTTTVVDREPYNIGETVGQKVYYKIWNVTDQKPACGTFEIVSGDVLWSPTGGPNVGVEIASTFTAYIDEEGVGSGQIETTNTDTGATSNITIDCVLYEDNEVWMSGANTAGDPVVAYARAGSDPAFNQWTNPNISPQDCTAKWSGASQFISGTIKMF